MHASKAKGSFATNIRGHMQPCLESIIIYVTHVLRVLLSEILSLFFHGKKHCREQKQENKKPP